MPPTSIRAAGVGFLYKSKFTTIQKEIIMLYIHAVISQPFLPSDFFTISQRKI